MGRSCAPPTRTSAGTDRRRDVHLLPHPGDLGLTATVRVSTLRARPIPPRATAFGAESGRAARVPPSLLLVDGTSQRLASELPLAATRPRGHTLNAVLGVRS